MIRLFAELFGHYPPVADSAVGTFRLTLLIVKLRGKTKPHGLLPYPSQSVTYHPGLFVTYLSGSYRAFPCTIVPPEGGTPNEEFARPCTESRL